MIKRLIVLIVIILLFYFILGYFAASNTWLIWFNMETYYSIGTIVGGVASVCGLLGLAYVKSTAKELEDIEANYLRQVANLRDELENKEIQVLTQTKDIAKLESKKEILELSIQRASRILFAENMKVEKEKEINLRITKDKKIIELIEEINEIDEDLERLGEEIKNDKNVEIISEILSKNGYFNKKENIDIFENIPENPITALFVIIGRLFKSIDSIMMTIIKGK